MYIKKQVFVILNIILFIIEIVLIYFMIYSYLTKDLIGPSAIPAYKYWQNKTSNIMER